MDEMTACVQRQFDAAMHRVDRRRYKISVGSGSFAIASEILLNLTAFFHQQLSILIDFLTCRAAARIRVGWYDSGKSQAPEVETELVMIVLQEVNIRIFHVNDAMHALTHVTVIDHASFSYFFFFGRANDMLRDLWRIE
jgi:hypothetical protein